MLKSLLAAAIGFFMATEIAGAAYCGRPRDDMKSITVEGTIKLLEKADASWGADRNWLELAECPSLGVVIKGANGCSVGKRIQATGEFFYCDEDSYDFDECSYDQIEAARYSCR